MQTINERAEEMIRDMLDWSDHAALGGELCLAAFYRKDGNVQVWIVDMSKAECNPDAAKKIGLVLNCKY